MIEVRELVRRYGDHCAVNGLSFTAEKGKIYGFLGPNGAGKSTTMNMMTGYLAASSGEVRIDGIDITRQPEKAKERIGYLPEIPPVYPDMTVREYLMFAAALRKVPKKDRKNAVSELMDRTGITEMADRLIKNLSKGYKQRVGLAEALINDPENIILDEPTAGLDPEQQKEMFDYINALKRDHTVILSSHILSDVNAVCDSIWIINHGKMVASGTPEELAQMNRPNGAYEIEADGTREQLEAVLKAVPGVIRIDWNADGAAIVMTDTDADLRGTLSRAVFQAGMTVLGLARTKKSLEDVFLSLTADDHESAAANLRKEGMAVSSDHTVTPESAPADETKPSDETKPAHEANPAHEMNPAPAKDGDSSVTDRKEEA
ncbi:MAG: ABC transporter ATP-binding protein [[Clostridium] aminophilum]|uniref:ABC transporter ATP-binding protein n=1 Tax=[Clostridium] aminophilum TaxID=1526 RepID=UPI0026F11543|nr:ABC transporter ATP-binding protein [[Clostridium] aminophilum]MDD6195800.1 ABC transporter ATP-binding protein [[Clostridium] aminophilum]